MQSAFVEYKNCMKAAADYYSASTASPREVADAAHSKCGIKFSAYERSTEDYLTSVVSTSKGVIMARDESRALTREMEGKVKEKVVQWVIENRLPKN
jgi:hypothetical protein